MEKITLYKTALAGLLLLNFVLVAFLWFGRPAAGALRFRALERFDLTEDQREIFQQSIVDHRSTMRQIDEEQRPLLKEYFHSLKTSTAGSAPPVPQEVLHMEQQKIQKTYSHLLAVKGILNQEQLAEYPAFIDFVTKQVLKKGEKPPNKNPT